MFFCTVPSANTLVRWVNENAFVSEVQTRPCPTFGRPVHLEDCPHRLRPGTSPHALRIPSRDGHPALRSTASGGFRSVLACIQLSPSCPFRRLHTLHFLRPARLRTPLLGYGAPHLSAKGTSTPPEQRAAQRTLPVCRPTRSYTPKPPQNGTLIEDLQG